jgi:hypothetical protein
MKKADYISIWTGVLASTPPKDDTIPFNKLSKEAQDLIVRASVGEFDDCEPPDISEEVKEEISRWGYGEN